MPKPLSPGLKTAFHRVGYIATAIVAVELLWLAALTGHGAVRQAVSDRADRAERRTYERPLQSDHVRRRFNAVAGLVPPGADSLRIYIDGALAAGESVMIVSAGQNGAPAHGVAADFDANPAVSAPVRMTRFDLPADAYAEATGRFDRMTDGWPGDSGLGTDGALVAFERIRGAKVTSGKGPTSSGSSHYADIEGLAWALRRKYAPAASGAQ